MKVLFITDQSLLNKDLNILNDNEVLFFSLSSDIGINKVNTNLLAEHSKKLEVLPSADFVNNEVDTLGKLLDKIRLDYSKIKYNDQYLIDEFMIDQEISSFYFTDLVERNVYKNQDHKTIAQFKAIKRILLENSDIDISVFLLADKKLVEALDLSKFKTNNLDHKNIYSLKFKKKLNLFKKFISGFVMGILYIFRLFFYYLIQKIYVRSSNNIDETKIKIVSYFPYLDIKEQGRKRFKNLYFSPLQEHLKKENIDYSWLLMFAKIKEKNYQESQKIANRLIEKNYLFLESMLNIRTIVKIFNTWFSQRIKYIFLRKRFFNLDRNDENCEIEEIYAEECLNRSYLGLSILSGISYYYIFKSYAQRIDNTKLLIYLNEMQTWERALNAAFSKYNKDVRRIGYQHSSVAKRIFHYYCEISESSESFNEPLPDYFAVNGELAYQELESSYRDKIIILEALRQIHNNQPDEIESKILKDRSLVTYIGSYDQTEAIKILKFLCHSFHERNEYKIMVKSHPSCILDSAVNKYRELYNLNIQTTDQDLNEVLRTSSSVIVGSSTAAIDALRNKCKIFVPIFADHIILSPLSGYDKFINYVSKPKDLIESIEDITEYNQKEIDEIEDFIHQFWFTDPKLKNWKKIIHNFDS